MFQKFRRTGRLPKKPRAEMGNTMLLCPIATVLRVAKAMDPFSIFQRIKYELWGIVEPNLMKKWPKKPCAVKRGHA